MAKKKSKEEKAEDTPPVDDLQPETLGSASTAVAESVEPTEGTELKVAEQPLEEPAADMQAISAQMAQMERRQKEQEAELERLRAENSQLRKGQVQEMPLSTQPATPVVEEKMVEVITASSFNCSIGGKRYGFTEDVPTKVPADVRRVLLEAGRLNRR